MKITKIFFAVVALLTIACKPNPNSGSGSTDKTKWLDEGKICGEWVMTKHSNKDTEIQVYIAFNEDSSFDLYQRVYSVVWLHYNGTFTLNGTTLSGKYSDGKTWGSRYTVSYAEAPNRIRLTSLDNKEEVAIYTEQAIPEYIVDESQRPEDVRSVEIERFL